MSGDQKHAAQARELAGRCSDDCPERYYVTICGVCDRRRKAVAAALQAAAEEARREALEEAARKLRITADDYEAANIVLGNDIHGVTTKYANACVRDELRAQEKQILALAKETDR
jgi:gamma-glutamyl phosphate reductase